MAMGWRRGHDTYSVHHIYSLYQSFGTSSPVELWKSMEWSPGVWNRERSRGEIEVRQDWMDPWADTQGLALNPKLKLTRSTIIPSKPGYGCRVTPEDTTSRLGIVESCCFLAYSRIGECVSFARRYKEFRNAAYRQGRSSFGCASLQLVWDCRILSG